MHLKFHASGASCTVVVSINAELSLDTRGDAQFAHTGFFVFTLQGSHRDMKVKKKKLAQDCMQHTQLFECTAQKWPLQNILGLYVILLFYSDTNKKCCYSHWINHLLDTAPHQSLLKVQEQTKHACPTGSLWHTAKQNELLKINGWTDGCSLEIMTPPPPPTPKR